MTVSTPSDTTITIDLRAREDVPAITDLSRFIQQDALKRLHRLIKEQIGDGEAAAKKVDGKSTDSGLLHNRQHNAIAVLGGRGSGKTTFILNALDLLLSGKAKKNSELTGNADTDLAIPGGDVVRLGVIDPTLIEAKEQILVTVLSRINEKVDAEHRRRRRDETFDENNSAAKDLEAVNERLKALAEGLCLLPGIGGNPLAAESWENPLYVMNNGLRKARSGSALERAFHEYINACLKYLGAKAFVLAFDDIDTDFSSGWPVLEMLRKYITHPKLIVILSGDFSLYSLLVRDRQWAMLRKLHKVDVERQSELRNEVARLESQYLQKVIKPNNRIELLPLNFYWENTSRRETFSIVLSSGETVTLEKMMQALTSHTAFSSNLADLELVAMLVLGQPVRTAMHLLRALDQNGILSEERENRDIRSLHSSLFEVFHSELQSMGLSADRINLAPLMQLPSHIHKFLTDNGLWMDGFRLKPDFQSAPASLAALCLAARFSQSTQQAPSLIIDYLLKICLIREMLIADPDLREKPELLFSFIGLDRQEPAWSVAARTIPVIRYEAELADRRPTLQGTIAVSYRRRYKRSKDKIVGTKVHFGLDETDLIRNVLGSESSEMDKFANSYIKRLEINEDVKDRLKNNSNHVGFLFNTWKSLETRSNASGAALLRMITVEVYSRNGLASAYLSVLPLIGLVGRLLEEQDALSMIKDLGMVLRSYQQPTWGKNTGTAPTDDDDEGDQGSEGEGSHEALQEYAKHLDSWADHATTDLYEAEPLPPYVLAKAWVRFFDTLKKIDDDIPHRDKYAGWLLHRQIVAFLNAILIEEARHRLGGRANGVSLSHPVTTDRFFLRNLRVLPNLREVPLFRALFSCPLWFPYLDPDWTSSGDARAEPSVMQRHVSLYPEFLKVDIGQEDLENFVPISFKTRLGRERDTAFPNLYPLLNSLLVIGRAEWNWEKGKTAGKEDSEDGNDEEGDEDETTDSSSPDAVYEAAEENGVPVIRQVTATPPGEANPQARWKRRRGSTPPTDQNPDQTA